MKTISLLSSILFLCISTFTFAQASKTSQQENIKVWGNCGMCKKTIETAAGYDTEKFTASQKAYDDLHSCCQYDRKGTTSAATEKTDCCKDGKCAANMADCCKEGKCSPGQACSKDKSSCKS